jgi:hypothetical protein
MKFSMVEEGDPCPVCGIGKMHVGGYRHDKGRANTDTFQGWENEREFICNHQSCGHKMRIIEKSFAIGALFKK